MIVLTDFNEKCKKFKIPSQLDLLMITFFLEPHQEWQSVTDRSSCLRSLQKRTLLRNRVEFKPNLDDQIEWSGHSGGTENYDLQHCSGGANNWLSHKDSQTTR